MIFSNRYLPSLILGMLFCFCLVSKGAPQDPVADAATSDSLYRMHHPRLLFTRAEIPALQIKVHDGGHDDDAFRYIRSLMDTVYSVQPVSDILGAYSFGVSDVPNLGVAAHLAMPPDSIARDVGRRLTIYLAEHFEPDDNAFYSSLRLRALSLGYDMFFEDRPETERAFVRHEIETYIDTMMADFNYERYLYRPYASNLSAMIGSSLGLAGICLAEEIDAKNVTPTLERADLFVETWLRYQLDPKGAYNEGAMYAGWSLRNLIYYFSARKRYDGYDYADEPAILNIEKWIAFALLPDGGGKINNINDTAYLNFPLSRHQTYFEWAQTAWQSGLSAWLWEHIVGSEYGHDSGRLADKAATVLWNQNLLPEQPGLVLPKHFLWQHRGLYYFRTGWQEGMSSDDVVFSFYSGKFQGGHAHEDQNSFTLYAYGEKFATDQGYGRRSKESEAHNIVFIDGKGQHNAGGAIGTDGKISEYLLGGYADYLLGDATSAYTTYSEFNCPDYPFPGDDWSWGYDGGNPVNFAHKRMIVLHDPETPPYFIMIDDIEKDDSLRTYEWRMHTLEDNTVDTSANPIRISGGAGHLNLYVLNPVFHSLEKRLIPFDNEEIDPNSTIVSLSQKNVSANFAFMMIPWNSSIPRPELSRKELPWGVAILLRWPIGVRDVLLINSSGDNVHYSVPAAAGPRGYAGGMISGGSGGSTAIEVETNASLAHFRLTGDRIDRYLLTNVSRFLSDRVPLVTIPEGTANVSLSAAAIHIDRDDIDFMFYSPGTEEVLCRDQSLAVTHEDGYILRDWSRGGSGPPKNTRHLRVWTYPNPFNETAHVYVEIGERALVSVGIYDARGRETRKIWNGVLPRGGNVLKWDGKNEKGQRVAAGVYFLRAHIPGNTQAVKLILLN